jgi:acetyltransferase-like isoleucine patch superfamily enzyme
MGWRDAIIRTWRHPYMCLVVTRMLLGGWYYRLKYKILGQHVFIGKRFRVEGRLDIQGPGTVIFGDDCTVVSSPMAPVTPYTHSSEATIQFGNCVVVNGTRFGCTQRIEVGEGCLLADARIMDGDFHALEPQGRHRWQTSGVTKPVIIGPNVWVCAGAMILKGVTIGANSVVAAGAVVVRDVPPNTVVAGNPARVVKRLPMTGCQKEQES